MDVPGRRDFLTPDAVKWYDRAVWLQGMTLDVPANERTAYQHNIDELWNAVDLFERGEEESLNIPRLQKIFMLAVERWSSYLGEEIPPELR